MTPYGVDPVFREPAVRPGGRRRCSRATGCPGGPSSTWAATTSARTCRLLAMAYIGLTGRRRGLPPLVLVGPGSHWAQGGTISGPQIRATGYLPARELRALMAASALLVLPSLEEGFGLPVAEAMTAGLPVVCSQGSALEEIAGDAALLVDPQEPRSIAARHRARAGRPAVAESLRQEGPGAQRALRLGRRRPPDPGLLPEAPRPVTRGAHASASTPASSRDDPPAPAATCATCCGTGRPDGGDDRFFAYVNGPVAADPVLRHERVARARGRERAACAASCGRSASCRRPCAPDAPRRLLLPRLLLPAAPRRPARHRGPRPVVLLVPVGLHPRRRTAPARDRGRQRARLAGPSWPARRSPPGRSPLAFRTPPRGSVHVPLGADDDLPGPASRDAARARAACAGRCS